MSPVQAVEATGILACPCAWWDLGEADGSYTRSKGDLAPPVSFDTLSAGCAVHRAGGHQAARGLQTCDVCEQTYEPPLISLLFLSPASA